MAEKIDEAFWLKSRSFQQLWQWGEQNLKSRRKEQLFAVACCRRLGRLLTDPRSVAAVDGAEAFADGEITRKTLQAIKRRALRAAREANPDLSTEWSAADAAEVVASGVRSEVFVTAVVRAAFAVRNNRRGKGAVPAYKAEEAAQAALLRDVFGNPFRPVEFDERWRTSTVASLARTMYESREFSAMPILADALQDAGCEDEQVLSHCRGKGVHVRGCWVVDLVLGKA